MGVLLFFSIKCCEEILDSTDRSRRKTSIVFTTQNRGLFSAFPALVYHSKIFLSFELSVPIPLFFITVFRQFVL